MQAAGDLRQVGAVAGRERELRLRGAARPLLLGLRRCRIGGRRQRLQRRSARRGSGARLAGRRRFWIGGFWSGMSAGGRMVGRLKICAWALSEALPAKVPSNIPTAQIRRASAARSGRSQAHRFGFSTGIWANSSQGVDGHRPILYASAGKIVGKRCPTPWNCSKPADRSSRWSSPLPDRRAAEIDTLLTIASRVPDHGKLTPWRFIVFEGEARAAAGEAIAGAFRAKYPDCQARAGRERAQAPRARAAGDRGGEPRRAAREDPGMGAGAFGRRRRDEPRARRPCARLRRQLDHRMVRL